MQFMQFVLQTNCIRANRLKIVDNFQYSCYLSYYDNLRNQKKQIDRANHVFL